MSSIMKGKKQEVSECFIITPRDYLIISIITT